MNTFCTLRWALLFALAGVSFSCPAPEATRQSAPAAGNHRNLFAENGHSPAEITNKINAVFTQLFHGRPDTQAIYFPAGTNASGALAYIWDMGSGDVRSEGMSYGMMIAVQLNRKTEFDALWNWAKTFMYHPATNHPSCGYFSWSLTTDGVAKDEMPAPDGEEYFVTSLYFAAARWGNSEGIYNYRAEADRLLGDLRHRQLITGPTIKGVITAGALFDPDQKIIQFTADVNGWTHTDPSYHLPAFYEFWAQCGPPADREFWAQAASASRDFLSRTANPATGLTPDYANFDGTPWTVDWNLHSGDFEYDAWRTAMNWSMDWSWWGKDARERELSDRLQAFFESKGMTNYGDRYTLSGSPIGTDHSQGLVAMNAVAGLAATNPRAKQFVEALWNLPAPEGQWRYYNGMLYLLAYLHCGGEFQAWSPATQKITPPSRLRANP